MLGLLAAYVVLGATQTGDARPPRPSDEQILAAVIAEAPGSRILSSTFTPTPRGGGWKGCGLIEVNGVVEPFTVLTYWRQARPEQQLISSISAPGPDGQMVTTAIPPTPARAAEWEIDVDVPTHGDFDGDGRDRYDRNRDIAERHKAVTYCPNLVAPEGVTWVLELEPHPDRAREARDAANARRITDGLFGARN